MLKTKGNYGNTFATHYGNISYNRGLVPLHNACSYGHYEVAELLLEVVTVTM